MAVRVEFLRVAMRGWGFPDDFVAAQVRELVGLSLPGGRLHERDVLVVACGDALSVVAEAGEGRVRLGHRVDAFL